VTRKMNESEPLMTCRKRVNEVETKGSRYFGTSMGAVCLRTMRPPALRWHELVAWQLCGTWEPSGPMRTEKSKRKPREDESRDAVQRGGTARSSVEASDKEVEQRSRVDGGKFNVSTCKGRNR
jgi:hypothetical protein